MSLDFEQLNYMMERFISYYELPEYISSFLARYAIPKSLQNPYFKKIIKPNDL